MFRRGMITTRGRIEKWGFSALAGDLPAKGDIFQVYFPKKTLFSKR